MRYYSTNKLPGYKQMKVLIVGAGISGLSMALALEQIGVQPFIIEKSSQLRADGTGIALPRNATELLAYLGIKNSLLNAARKINSITYSEPNGCILSKAILADYFNEEYPFVGIKRKDLIELLSKPLTSKIAFNKFITNINRLNKKETSVTFNDGSQDVFDIIIAADGIHSSIRNMFLKNTCIEDLGLTVFRFLANHRQEDPVYYFGNQTAFMIYPVNLTQSYCYGHITNSLIDCQKISSHNISAFFGEYSAEVKSLIQDNKSRIILGKMLSVSDPVFIKDNIVFIGDASHACSPMLQQGAASALEDAIAFSTFLKETSDIKQTMKHYELFRKPRVNWVKSQSDSPLKQLSNHQDTKNFKYLIAHIRENGPLNVLKWRELFSTNYIQQVNLYLASSI